MNNDFLTNNPEKKYLNNSNYKLRKKKGQFFTSKKIAEFMAKWCLKNNSGFDFLEPGLGLGIFSRMVAKHNPNVNFFGYEKDPKIYNKASELFKNENLNFDFKNKDFLFDFDYKKYDGILCNPPYLKFHDFSQQKLLAYFNKIYKINLSKLTNIYTLFLIKAVYSLKKGGKAAFLVPAEFLNANYGTKIKNVFKNKKMIKHIIIFKNDLNIFSVLEDIITTSCIILFENSNIDAINFINIDSLNKFKKVSTNLLNNGQVKTGRTLSLKQLKPEQKWSIYYNNIKKDYYNPKRMAEFSKYFKLKRGIATGANKYFTFSKSQLKKYNLNPNENHFKHCLTKAKQIKNLFFTEKNLKKLKNEDERIYLLYINKDENYYLDKNTKYYLELGIKDKIHKRYLPKNRDPWYSSEQRISPDIFVKVFNRKNLLFTKNETNAINLTSFHCIYVKDKYSDIEDLLFSYLNTNIAKKIFSINKREYGSGLHKFEPNDIKNSLVIDFDQIENSDKRNILNRYKSMRKKSINNEDVQDDLNILNNIYKKLIEIK